MLAPLLFLILISDAEADTSHSFISFANVTRISVKMSFVGDTERVELETNQVFQAANGNDMISAGKCFSNFVLGKIENIKMTT